MPSARPFYDRDAVLSMKNYEYEDNEIHVCDFAASNRVCNMYIVFNIIEKKKLRRRRKKKKKKDIVGFAVRTR